MTKKVNMSVPAGEVAKPKSERVRHFVFALLVTSAATLGFFPSGHLDVRLFTAVAARLSEGWQAIGLPAPNLPKFQFAN